MKEKVFKNALLFGAFLLVLSCSDEENVAGGNPDVANCEVKVVQVSNDGCVKAITRSDNVPVENLALQFKSETEFQRFLSIMKKKSHDERIHTIASIGMTSLEELLVMADKELDAIGEQAKDEADFRLKYNRYKDRYKKVFVFNENKDDDLSIYIPASSNDLNSYIAGPNKMVVIGDRVDTIPFKQEMRDGDKFLFASSLPEYNEKASTRAFPTEDGVNGFIKRDGSKKYIFGVSLVGYSSEVNMHFGAQKKMWYGWKRDNNRDFFAKVAIDNFEYAFYDGAGVYYVGSPRDVYDAYGTGNHTFILGRCLGNLDVVCRGSACLWTDYTAERDGNGKYIIDKVNGRNMQRLLNDKAYSCKIELRRMN